MQYWPNYLHTNRGRDAIFVSEFFEGWQHFGCIILWRHDPRGGEQLQIL